MVVIYVDNGNMKLLLIVVIVVRFSWNCEARSLHNCLLPDFQRIS